MVRYSDFLFLILNVSSTSKHILRAANRLSDLSSLSSNLKAPGHGCFSYHLCRVVTRFIIRSARRHPGHGQLFIHLCRVVMRFIIQFAWKATLVTDVFFLSSTYSHDEVRYAVRVKATRSWMLAFFYHLRRALTRFIIFRSTL